MAEAVKVVVRCRPLSGQEIKDERKKIVSMDAKAGRVVIKNEKDASASKTYTFDAVFPEGTKQRDLYDQTVLPIVNGCLEGYNGTIFAYGQTGTGKTFTMEGKEEPRELRGVIPNAFEHIFETIALNEDKNKEFLVSASFIEIYNEEVRDLLSRNYARKLELRETKESGVFVANVTTTVVKSKEEIDRIMQAGMANRQVGSTKMNMESSRSHSIFMITIETSEVYPDGEAHIRVGKLNLVDLAGSERQGKTGAEGKRFIEAKSINMSLSCLGNVISALTDPKTSHIPYRDSKLTRLLQDSLGGNARTVMIANIGPAEYNFDETISTLRYANRAKRIKNKPKINEDPKDAMLREFQEEIERLKKALENAGGPGVPGAPGTAPTGSGSGAMSAETLAQLEREQREKEELLKQKGLAEEEKQRIQQEKDKAAKLLEEERAKRDAMEKSLAAMQAKLLHGGENLLDKAERQEAELRKRQAELRAKEEAERLLQQRLEAEKEERLVIDQQFASVKEEVDVKTKQLKKLWAKLQEAKAEIKDMQDEAQREREEKLDIIRNQSQQLKLKSLVIREFIPPAEVSKIERRAVWDDDEDDWQIPKPDMTGNALNARRPHSATNGLRAVSEYARMQQANGSNAMRFNYRNILQLDLDMPDRTTADYGAPGSEAYVQQVLDSALDAQDNGESVFFSYAANGGNGERSGNGSRGGDNAADAMQQQQQQQQQKRAQSSSRSKRPGSARGKARGVRNDEAAQYPQARGLVQSSKRYI